MLAIVLAAGKGSRMKYLTQSYPKAMLPFQGKSLLSYQIELFKKHDLDYFVVGGYKYNSLSVPLNKIICNKQYASTNMVYSLYLALKKLISTHNRNDFIVSYGDIVFEEKVLESLINTSSDADIHLIADKNYQKYWQFRMYDPINDIESFNTNKTSGFIANIGERASSFDEAEAQYIGLFKISSTYVHTWIEFCESYFHKDSQYKNISMTKFLSILIKHEGLRIRPEYIHSGWLEFDTNRDLDTYNKAFVNGSVRCFFRT